MVLFIGIFICYSDDRRYTTDENCLFTTHHHVAIRFRSFPSVVVVHRLVFAFWHATNDAVGCHGRDLGTRPDKHPGSFRVRRIQNSLNRCPARLERHNAACTERRLLICQTLPSIAVNASPSAHSLSQVTVKMSQLMLLDEMKLKLLLY